MDLRIELVTVHEILLRPYRRILSDDYHQNVYYFFRVFSDGYYVGDMKLYIDIKSYEGRIDSIYITKMFRNSRLSDSLLLFVESFFTLKGCSKILIESTSESKDFYIAHNYTQNQFSYLEKNIIPIVIQDVDISYLREFIRNSGMYDSLKNDEGLFEDIFDQHICPEEVL